jgi:hypothetical protein
MEKPVERPTGSTPMRKALSCRRRFRGLGLVGPAARCRPDGRRCAG